MKPTLAGGVLVVCKLHKCYWCYPVLASVILDKTEFRLCLSCVQIALSQKPSILNSCHSPSTNCQTIWKNKNLYIFLVYCLKARLDILETLESQIDKILKNWQNPHKLRQNPQKLTKSSPAACQPSTTCASLLLLCVREQPLKTISQSSEMRQLSPNRKLSITHPSTDRGNC